MSPEGYKNRIKEIADKYNIVYDDVVKTCEGLCGGALDRTDLFFEIVTLYGGIGHV